MKPVKNINTATRLAAARAAPTVGQVIGDRYRLEEPLERGAMGSVWRAEQIRLRAPVALKFLDPSLIGDPEMHDRFMQEARSAAAVRSVHVVQIFDYGSEGNIPYIAMELLEGENLDARLSSRGTLTPAELNKIFSEVARGIGKAHAMGVIHRDVKPGNIFITREGEHEVTKLIDFGIAKVKADALKFTQIVGTQLGTLLGTPQYMSPEQVRGSSTVDHRTDLWALAIIACECLTGRYPFSGTTIGDLTVQICTEKPSAPSSLGPVPAGFDQWFFKGTSKKPIKRFGSVEEMAEALHKILSTSDDTAPTVAWAERLRALPQKLELNLPGAWAAASTRLGGAWALLEQKSQRMADEISRSAAWLRAQVVALGKSERLGFARPLWSRAGLLASVLLLIVLGLGVSWARRGVGTTPRIQPEQATGEQAPRQASPPAAPPRLAAAAAAPAAAPAAEEVVLSALPAAEPPGVESEPLAAEQPAQHVATELPRSKSERTPAASAPAAAAAAAPSVKPISAAMARAAARIMQADADRAKAAASASAKPLARSSQAARPASAKPASKGGAKASAAQSHPFDDRL